MQIDELRNIAIIIGTVIAVIALFKGIFEYLRQGSQKRSEYFNIMRKKFKENETLKKICNLLETDSKEICSVSFADKRDFLGFFEEIALMINSRIIKKQVAHYMFGYYAIRCIESNYFWKNVNIESYYWRLFIKFAEDMKNIEKKFKFKNSYYKF